MIGLAAALPSIRYLPARARGGKLALKFAPEVYSSETYYLEVPLGNETFKIRYHVDSSYFDEADPDAPIFVSMGGEGTSNGVSCSANAQKHKALCVGVEHRFYGESLPAGGATTDNYVRGLSVEANLNDTRDVIARVWETVGVRPVINQGGSYSGSTCSFFRQAFPEYTAACVSLSGVVNTILDFYQFDAHVDQALLSPDGQECSELLGNATAAMERLFASGRKDDVKRLFNASNLIGTPMGDNDFWYAVADGPQMMDQYGSKGELCAALKPAASDWGKAQNLADVIYEHYGKDFVSGCFYDSECLKTFDDVDSRSWRFQKCSQVAYLQRAPDVDSLRSSALTLDALEAQCKYVFDDSRIDLQDANSNFLAKFGGPQPRSGAYPNTTNIFYEAYSDDPWFEASVQEETHPTLPYCMTTCDGCGHCGAGVPANLTECTDKAADFVDAILADAKLANKLRRERLLAF